MNFGADEEYVFPDWFICPVATIVPGPLIVVLPEIVTSPLTYIVLPARLRVVLE